MVAGNEQASGGGGAPPPCQGRCLSPLSGCGAQNQTKPVRSTQLLEGPWKEISVDLLDISNGELFLVVVDYYSRWTEAIILKKTDAQHVVKSMEAFFRTHGLPETVRSDMDLHLHRNSLKPS